MRIRNANSAVCRFKRKTYQLKGLLGHRNHNKSDAKPGKQKYQKQKAGSGYHISPLFPAILISLTGTGMHCGLRPSSALKTASMLLSLQLSVRHFNVPPFSDGSAAPLINQLHFCTNDNYNNNKNRQILRQQNNETQ